MTTMGYVAQEVRKMYLSKLKKVNPYKCNVMFPKVRLSQLNAKVMEKYTRQHKGFVIFAYSVEVSLHLG